MTVDAKEYVGLGFPPEEGKKLAAALLAQGQRVDWRDLTIDVTNCPASLLISAFFNGFLQEVHDQKADLLPAAQKIEWEMKFPFQKENVRRWMAEFKAQA